MGCLSPSGRRTSQALEGDGTRHSVGKRHSWQEGLSGHGRARTHRGTLASVSPPPSAAARTAKSLQAPTRRSRRGHCGLAEGSTAARRPRPRPRARGPSAPGSRPARRWHPRSESPAPPGIAGSCPGRSATLPGMPAFRAAREGGRAGPGRAGRRRDAGPREDEKGPGAAGWEGPHAAAALEGEGPRDRSAFGGAKGRATLPPRPSRCRQSLPTPGREEIRAQFCFSCLCILIRLQPSWSPMLYSLAELLHSPGTLRAPKGML